MDKIKHNIKLDLADGGSQDAVYLRQNDTRAHLLIFQLRTNGRAYRIADNVVAKIRGKREDGSIIYNACEIEDNVIRTTISTQTISIPGRVECVLELTGTEPAVLTTPGFDIIVERVDNSDNDILGTNELSALVAQTAETKALQMEIERKLAAGEFDGEEGYSPEVTVTPIENGYRLEVQNKDTQYSVDIIAPEKGDQGVGIESAVLNADYTLTLDFTDGSKYTTPSIRGEKGVSPEVSVAQITNGHRVTIVDSNGTKSFDVLNGSKGDPGNDGFSPIIDTQNIQGGHRIIIQDKHTTRHVDVMDGEPGNDGITPAFSIGTVTTLSAGSNATASIGGTVEKPVLNLGIPKGADGKDGEDAEGGGGTAELPFELETENGVILAETTVQVGATISGQLNLITGEHYTVTVDGVSYDCTCYETLDDDGRVWYRDLTSGGDTGVSAQHPVRIRAYIGTWRLSVLNVATGQSQKLSIVKTVQNQQIPARHVAKIPTSSVTGLESVLAKLLGGKDVINNLSSSVSNRPLSASMGMNLNHRLVALEENGGGGGVTSWNDLTDRPFYEEREETVVLEDTVLEYSDDIGGHVLPQQVAVTEGESYEVVWNGDKYMTACVIFEDGGMSAGVLGNIGAMTGGEDTGEPFVILCFPQEGFDATGVWGMAQTLDGSTDPVAVSITHVVETVKKIDPKFVEADWNTMLNKPFGTTEEYGTVLAESELALNALFGFFIITEDFVVKAGREYTVVYNGTTYHTKGYDRTGEDENGNVVTEKYIGNMSPLNEADTGEPFLILYSPEQMQGIGGYAVLMPLDGAESVTLSIEGIVETVHKLDPKYIDVDVDWDDISNRPFYKEWADGEVLPETTVTFTAGLATMPNELSLVAGKTYSVVFDGTTYECVAMFSSEEDETGDVVQLFILGDAGRVETGEPTTGEPFCITTASKAMYVGNKTVFFAFEAPNSATISITGMTAVIHPLPEEYLPESVKAALDGDTPIVIRGTTPSVGFNTAYQLSVEELQRILVVISPGTPYSTGSVFGVKKGDNIISFFALFDGSSVIEYAWDPMDLLTMPSRKLAISPNSSIGSNGTLALFMPPELGSTEDRITYVAKEDFIQDVISALPIYNGEVE